MFYASFWKEYASRKNINPERTKDERQEYIINQYLLANYFNKAFTSACLIDDTSLQNAGVDVMCSSELGEDMKIDVKAQSSAKYINNPRPTFLLEVSTYNRYGTEECVGWFFDAQKITEYYTFVWIHEARVDAKGRILRPEDIQRVEVLIVDAKKLQDYIDDVLWDYSMDDIDSIVSAMRSKELMRQDVCKGIHYSHSTQLIEKPVNLVVHKRILKKFAIPGPYGHCMVSQQKITAIT